MTIGKTFSLAIRPLAYVRLFGLALGLLLLFPLGVASFVAVVVGFTVPAAFVAAPFIYRNTDIDLGPIAVDTLGEALLMSLVGFLGVLLLLHLSNGAAALLERFVSIRIGAITLGRTKS